MGLLWLLWCTCRCSRRTVLTIILFIRVTKRFMIIIMGWVISFRVCSITSLFFLVVLGFVVAFAFAFGFFPLSSTPSFPGEFDFSPDDSSAANRGGSIWVEAEALPRTCPPDMVRIQWIQIYGKEQPNALNNFPLPRHPPLQMSAAWVCWKLAE